jgi:hypothetical protein
MEKDGSDILVFTYIDEDGRRVFRCRGSTGNTYKLLYEKLYESSYKCILYDFPWDYWIFENKRDEESFLEAFSWFIIEDIE